MDKPSLPGFVEWLSRKDPNERYEWPKAQICACGQYAASLGLKEWIGTGGVWSKLNRIAHGTDLRGTHIEYDSRPEKWTFGRCLELAKKELEAA